MQFGKLGKFFRRKQKNADQNLVCDNVLSKQQDISTTLNEDDGPPKISLTFQGQQVFIKYSGKPEYLKDAVTRFVFGQFCIMFKDSLFETIMRNGLLAWAKKSDDKEIERIAEICFTRYGEEKTQPTQ